MIKAFIDRILRGYSHTEISAINRYIFNLPTGGVPYKEEIYNKHLQNLVWTFWFGEVLHK